MNQSDLMNIAAQVGVQFIPFLFALCFHELAHGYVAKKKGDNTAELMGRLTMNPFAHADPIGTFFLPLIGIVVSATGTGGSFMFGWAKPVPVNERNLSHPKQDMFWIALAGPLSNLLLGTLAIAAAIGVDISMATSPLKKSIETLLIHFIGINMMLFIFNLIPLHPLDGGKVLARFLPPKANRFMEENQSTFQWILIGFFLIGGFRYLAIPIRALINLIYSTIISAFGMAS